MGYINFTSLNGETQKVLVPIFNPSYPSIDEIKGLYVEKNGYVSIDVTGFHRKREIGEIKFKEIE